jgi:hypothetical protein
MVYLMAIWYIFTPLGMLYKAKSGNRGIVYFNVVQEGLGIL